MTCLQQEGRCGPCTTHPRNEACIELSWPPDCQGLQCPLAVHIKLCPTKQNENKTPPRPLARLSAMPELDWELEDEGPSIVAPTDARAAVILAGFKM